MTEATQTATTNDARQASMSRVETQETILARVAPQGAASAPAEPEKAEADPNKEGDSKPKKSPQERIQELANKRREAEAEADAAKRENAELKARLDALSAQAKPLENEARPLRSQFADDEAYAEAVGDWSAKRAIAKREEDQRRAREEAAQAELAGRWTERQEAVMKVLPDYADVIGKSEISIPNHVHAAILDSDQGPQIAYYLALHPEEAKRIVQMSPVSAIKRIAALERDLADIEAEDPPPKKEAKEDPKQPQKSKAPPPIDLPKSVPSTAGAANSDFEEYRRRRQAEKSNK